MLYAETTIIQIIAFAQFLLLVFLFVLRGLIPGPFRTGLLIDKIPRKK